MLMIPLGAASASAGAPAPAADGVTVQLVTANGSGCPPGSITVAPVDTGDAFTVLFSQFDAYGGTNKNCLIVVKIGVPAGWTYAVYGIINRGFAQLDAGATGQINMDSWFTGFPWTVSESKTLTGPYRARWQTENFAGALTWAPCSGRAYNMNIDDTISVVGPNTSSVSFHAADISASVLYQLRLRRCPRNEPIEN
jgi:hypothetical protein